MEFEIRALNSEQQIQSLRLEATDEGDARTQLQARQLSVLSLRPASRLRGSSFSSIGKKQFNLLLFAQELLALIAAGLSVWRRWMHF